MKRRANRDRFGGVTALWIEAMLAAWLLLCPTIRDARADQNDPRLDTLFSELQRAQSAAVAERIDNRIWAIWHESGSGVVDLMMTEGLKALALGRHKTALEAFDTAVETAPEFAEAWNKRATVHFLLGNYEASRRDAEMTLELEPRHFGAMSGLGAIHMTLGQPAEALEWFRRAIEIHPHLEGVRKRIRSLEAEVEGRAI